MVKRELYMEQVKRLIDKDLIKIITGIRRSGKSYFLNQIVEELKNNGVEEENFIFIDLEHPKYNSIETREELDEFLIPLIESGNHRKYLFLDEIQNVENWEISVNSYYKSFDIDIFITGSNSKLLSKELATLLTGRYIEIRMYPFSFKEFLLYKHEIGAASIFDSQLYTDLENLFEEYLQYGGMPAVISAEAEDKLVVLRDLYSSIFLYDVVERYQIRNMGLLKRITNSLIENVGNLISANSIYKYLKQSKLGLTPNTIYNYLEYLENANFISKVTREDVIGLNEINYSEKYYLIDLGFYKSLLEEKQENRGHLIENLVYLELLRHGYKITIGIMGDMEVDFIARKGNEKIYIQVAYTIADEKTANREFKPLMRIPDNYPKYILTTDKEDKSRRGIMHLNVITFLKDFL
ncbi:ATP-binding protein [uncultured Methanobrevibacter sp.]|uniref:ATP-binding protein n=1 Tax=uncultured Methanobrevibacter sp. TaxID=253161 RepID=UPI0025E718D4|nr:ATP-binding protein [uncultured Methanobrevibacter sp.]